jgi:hypothetical protein
MIDAEASLMTPERYEGAARFAEFLEQAVKHAQLWRDTYRLVRLPEGALERAASVGGRWHLAVLVEDWCGDAVNTVPIVARLAELAPNLDLRVLARDHNLDLMDSHLTGTSRSIPVVIALDDHFREHGWWGPRPTALQRWVLGPGMLLEKEPRYREVRSWYARDRGSSTLEEVVRMLEAAAAGDAGRNDPES